MDLCKTKRRFIVLFVVSLAVFILFSVPSALDNASGSSRRNSVTATLKPFAKQPGPILTASATSPQSPTKAVKEDAVEQAKCRSTGEAPFESDTCITRRHNGKVIHRRSSTPILGTKIANNSPGLERKEQTLVSTLVTTIWEPSEAVYTPSSKIAQLVFGYCQ